MVLKTKDLTINLNQFTLEGNEFSAKGKTALKIEGWDGDLSNIQKMSVESNNLIIKLGENQKILISNYTNLKYIKNANNNLFNFIEANIVENKNPASFNQKTLKITGTSYNDTINGVDFLNTLSAKNQKRALTINGGKGNDSITGGEGKDRIYGGDGNDTIDGGNNNDILYGNNGNDSIIGGNGNDKIYGDTGDDYIEGGKGNDTITGGSGTNTIVYSLGDGDDIINLTKNEILKLNLTGIDFNDTEYQYSNNKKDLTININKNDTTGSINLKNFAYKNITKGASVDFSGDLKYLDDAIINTVAKKNFTGTGLKDNIDASTSSKGLILNGAGGDDTIKGGYGNDKIYGGAGDDYIEGGEGNDTITGGSGTNNITYKSGNGNDTIYLTKGEKLELNLAGFNKDNTKYQYTNNKKDLIIYVDKNDTTKGSLTLKNFAQKDIINNATKKTEDTSSAKVFFVDGEDDLKKDVVINTTATKNFTGTWLKDNIDASNALLVKKIGNNYVEKSAKDKGLTLNGAGGDDTIIGSKYSDIIYGSTGNDSLSGREGNDKIYGGAGDDYIEGGEGNDTITGGSGTNTIVYRPGDGNDVINLTKGENLKLKLLDIHEDAFIFDISYEISSNGKDVLIYANNSDRSEYITIKDFAQKNILNSMQISINNGSYIDINDIRFSVNDINKNYKGGHLSEIINASSTNLYKYVNGKIVEKSSNDKGLTLSGGAGNNLITGTKYSDIIYGDNGTGRILAGNGNDTIYGSKGDYTINGGEGDDYIISSAGSGDISGDNGNDTIDCRTGKTTKINGGLGDDLIYAGKYTQTIYGDEGDDTIYGSDVDQIINGGNGNNVIYSGGGNNGIYCNNDNDIIYCGKGTNEINTHKGNDTIICGGGKTTLSYTSGDGDDTIYLAKDEDITLNFNDIDFDKILFECSEDKKDLIVYTNKDNKSQGSITFKNMVAEDVTKSAKINVSSYVVDLKEIISGWTSAQNTSLIPAENTNPANDIGTLASTFIPEEYNMV